MIFCIIGMVLIAATITFCVISFNAKEGYKFDDLASFLIVASVIYSLIIILAFLAAKANVNDKRSNALQQKRDNIIYEMNYVIDNGSDESLSYIQVYDKVTEWNIHCYDVDANYHNPWVNWFVNKKCHDILQPIEWGE